MEKTFGLPAPLAKRLAAITPDRLVPPKEIRPKGVEAAAVLPEDLRSLITLAHELLAECEARAAEIEVVGAHYREVLASLAREGDDAYLPSLRAFVANPAHLKHIVSASLWQRYLPKKQEWLKLVAEAFDAEFKRRFPELAEQEVHCYRDWSLAVPPEEEGDLPASMLLIEDVWPGCSDMDDLRRELDPEFAAFERDLMLAGFGGLR